MNIMLDSNIYLLDSRFRRELVTLTQYLIPTSSTIVLSRIVQEETQAVFRRNLKNAIKSVEREGKNVKRYAEEFILPKIDIEVRTQDFTSLVANFPAEGQTLYIDLSPDDIIELTRMAANRTRPFNAEGHGFRDAAIWLTLVNHARRNPDVEVAFISQNTSEFSQRGNSSNFHPELVEQLDSQGIKNIRYYSSIPNFLQRNLPVATTFDLSVHPLALISNGDQLSKFERSLTADLYVDEEHNFYSGEFLTFENTGEFSWNPLETKVFRLNDQENYILIEVAAAVKATENQIFDSYTDDFRDEVYEDYYSGDVQVSLVGTLSLTIGPKGIQQQQILKVQALEVKSLKS